MKTKTQLFKTLINAGWTVEEIEELLQKESNIHVTVTKFDTPPVQPIIKEKEYIPYIPYEPWKVPTPPSYPYVWGTSDNTFTDSTNTGNFSLESILIYQ